MGNGRGESVAEAAVAVESAAEILEPGRVPEQDLAAVPTTAAVESNLQYE